MDCNPHSVVLDDLEIGSRAKRALEFAHCRSLADILLLGRRRLDRVQSCGPKTVDEIARAVSHFGFRL